MRKGCCSGLFMVLILSCLPSAIASSEGEGLIVYEVYLLVREKELMAFSAVADVWVTEKFRLNERVLNSKFGGHVAVVFTNLRVLAFSVLTNKWTEERLMVDESMVSIEAKGNVGAAVTNLRALGFSAKTGKWVIKRFGPK